MTIEQTPYSVPVQFMDEYPPSLLPGMQDGLVKFHQLECSDQRPLLRKIRIHNPDGELPGGLWIEKARDFKL